MSPIPLVAVPLLALLGVLATGARHRVQALLILIAALSCLVWTIALVVAESVATVNMGGWPTPLGISLRADALSRLFLLVNSFVFVVASIELTTRTARTGDDDPAEGPSSLSAYPALLLALDTMFLTADFFDFYVFFELMGISAFLLVMRGSREPLEAGWKFAVQSIVGSLSLLAGVSFLYGLTGTLDMEGAADFLDRSPSVLWTASLFLFAFLLKSSVFPFHWWQADAHAASTTPGSVVLAGAIINSGIYGIMRFWPLLYGEAFGWLLGAVGIASMFVGALAAVRSDDAKRVLGYSSTSQLGFVLLALSWSAHAVAAFFLVAHAMAKSALFLATGFVGERFGTYSLRGLSGAGLRHPVPAYTYLLGFGSLVGLPPTVGFVGKVGLFGAGLESGDWGGLALAGFGSLATLGYGLRAYQTMFMGGDGSHPEPVPEARARFSHVAMVVAVLAVVAAGVLAEPLWQLSEAAAAVGVQG